MIDFEMNNKIEYIEEFDKKWQFLQYVYKFRCLKEFASEPVKIVETNDMEHYIYLNITMGEFCRYLYFLDIKKAQLRGKNADCIVKFDDGSVKLTFYDKLLVQQMEDIINEMKNVEFSDIPNFDLKMYFFVPERDANFYYQFISFVYYLSEVDVPAYGIKICDRKGNFQRYNSLKFPHENLDKFLYFDGNIFIGSHSQNNMIVTYNLPRNKLLELRRWCNEYEDR